MGRVYFYRPSAFAGGLKPAILLNDTAVGIAEPKAYLFVDRDPGQYTVRTSVILEHARRSPSRRDRPAT